MMAESGITVTGTVIISLLTTLGGGMVVLFKLYVSAKDKALADMESLKKSYEEIANEAIKSAKETQDYYRVKYEGKAPIILAAPVISESHSPSTKVQRETAQVATMRASLAKIKLEAEQLPRVEPEHKKE